MQNEKNDDIITVPVGMPEVVNMQRVQLLLAEQRTSLALLRTGIAIFTLPLSVLTVLIATSKNYEIMEILSLLIPTALILLGLIVLAVWMIWRAWKTIARIRITIDRIKSHDEYLREFLQ